MAAPDYLKLKDQICGWAKALGFQAVGVSLGPNATDIKRFHAWLAQDMHGDMGYMARNTKLREHPEQLVEGTLRIISLRMDYWPADAKDADEVLEDSQVAYVARYAMGRDYHKLIRKRLKKLAERIQQAVPSSLYRVFTDSAPVLEKPSAQNAGLGWIGKHTNLIDHKMGSYFFLGELFTNLPLPIDEAATDHCGTCRRCIDICPTQAIIDAYQLDARRCIAYLTIEHHGAIPIEFRKDIGNRIFGCDDCQLVCPWNRYASASQEIDFSVRHHLDASPLSELFLWTEEEFLKKTEGSAIRRLGFNRWLRNIAIGLGNATTEPSIVAALQQRLKFQDPMVKEHIEWALSQHQ